MSGVLERMAKRALGRLHTMQPLIRSSYAVAPVDARKPSSSEFLPSNEKPERATSAPARTPIQANEEPGAASQRPRAAAAPRLDEVARHVETRMERHMPQPPEKPAAEAPIPLTISFASQPEISEAPADSEPLVEADVTAPIIPMHQDDAAAVVEELVPTIGASHQPARISQAMVQPRHMRAESAAFKEQKTEIHISIGSIELRAAPAEPRPAAPASFRPRVSLQDFLKRGTGAHR
jgi:hypothetical protein